MIRQASVDDTETIIGMLEHYRQASPLAVHAETTDATARLMLKIMFEQNRGIIFLAEKAGQVIGLLVAIKNFNIWDQKALCLNELAFWVEPEHRGGTAGHRLLKAYCDVANYMKSAGEIKYFTISKMVTSPDLDYGRWGFAKLEESWSQ